MSLDGRTAMSSGESKWITGEASRSDVQRLRAESSAILTGVGTVLADDPSMDVRSTAEQLDVDVVRQPRRIVVDSQFRMPVDVKISGTDNACTVYTTIDVDDPGQYPFTIRTIDSLNGQVDLHRLMQDLADSEINLLHVEAGSVLCGALLKDDLVDEIILYVAPHILGGEAKALFSIPGLEKMEDRIALEMKDVRALGNDLRLTLAPVKACS
jgi:diaminohydroxyphosphoribosylaminopyrimidine deaminase/5-amino-6-(5-phosphoribosylamino)uracil reductase